MSKCGLKYTSIFSIFTQIWHGDRLGWQVFWFSMTHNFMKNMINQWNLNFKSQESNWNTDKATYANVRNKNCILHPQNHPRGLNFLNDAEDIFTNQRSHAGTNSNFEKQKIFSQGLRYLNTVPNEPDICLTSQIEPFFWWTIFPFPKIGD